jgi:phosphomannomutase
MVLTRRQALILFTYLRKFMSVLCGNSNHPLMTTLIIGISGARGIVGDSLTPDVLVQLAAAFGEFCGRGPIIIGRDGRTSGKMCASLASSTLVSMGLDVVALGIAPTPTVGLAVEKSHAAGGISITASHNPIEWNGLKFFDDDGLFLDEAANKRLQHLLTEGMKNYVGWDKLGHYQLDESFLDHHRTSVTALPYLDIEGLRNRRFKVVADCVNGSGSVVVPRLLQDLGCEVIRLNCEPSGIFPHNPEPLPQHLGDLCEKVRLEKADLGIAVDPDADRLVLITEEGKPFGEEYTIASCVMYVLETEKAKGNRKLKVCVNLSTTRAVDDIAAEYQAQVIRTPVGELNVARKTKEVGAVIAGEGSGGVILPAVHLRRDALVGIALTLQHLLEFGGRLSDLKKSLPEYHIYKKKVELTDSSIDSIIAELSSRCPEARINTDDGLRLDFKDHWVNLRKSNTEPILRIIAEASTVEKAQDIVEKFAREVACIS